MIALIMEEYSSRDEYESQVRERAALPDGFKSGSCRFPFYCVEKKLDDPLEMDLSLIMLEQASDSFAALFTQNAVTGFPVQAGRTLLAEAESVQGILINNKISNVFTSGGDEDMGRVIREAEKCFDMKAPLFPSSTGIIGWKLPVKDMILHLDKLKQELQDTSIFSVAKGIMTTDSFVKVRSLEVGSGRITAIAKGAGMIEPDMATMLCFVLTDIDIDKEALQQALKECVTSSLNCLSVDSDQSTSDSVIALSSRKYACSDKNEFNKALLDVLEALSEDIVRNGEGTGHVLEVEIDGADTQEEARALGKALVNSPLTKTAVFGNDPNVGRFLQALGSCAGKQNINLDTNKLTICLGGVCVFQEGAFSLSESKERELNRYLEECSLPLPSPGYPVHNRNVSFRIDLKQGHERARILGSDLSYEYIRENADYRS